MKKIISKISKIFHNPFFSLSFWGYLSIIPLLSSIIKITKPGMVFLSNLLVFSVVLFVFGLFIREADFVSNFWSVLILGQILNAFFCDRSAVVEKFCAGQIFRDRR